MKLRNTLRSLAFAAAFALPFAGSALALTEAEAQATLATMRSQKAAGNLNAFMRSLVSSAAADGGAAAVIALAPLAAQVGMDFNDFLDIVQAEAPATLLEVREANTQGAITNTIDRRRSQSTADLLADIFANASAGNFDNQASIQ